MQLQHLRGQDRGPSMGTEWPAQGNFKRQTAYKTLPGKAFPRYIFSSSVQSNRKLGFIHCMENTYECMCAWLLGGSKDTYMNGHNIVYKTN